MGFIERREGIAAMAVATVGMGVDAGSRRTFLLPPESRSPKNSWHSTIFS
jgi:hypothetical protein